MGRRQIKKDVLKKAAINLELHQSALVAMKQMSHQINKKNNELSLSVLWAVYMPKLFKNKKLQKITNTEDFTSYINGFETKI